MEIRKLISSWLRSKDENLKLSCHPLRNSALELDISVSQAQLVWRRFIYANLSAPPTGRSAPLLAHLGSALRG